MSYTLEDARGYVGDLASGGGLHDLFAWLAKHGGPLAAFAEIGYTDDPIQLAAALTEKRNDATGSVLATIDGLIKMLRQATRYAVIRDGIEESTMEGV